MTKTNNQCNLRKASLKDVLSRRERIMGWNDFIMGTWQEFTEEKAQRRYESGRQLAATVQAALRKIGFAGRLPRIRNGMDVINLLGYDTALQVWQKLAEFIIRFQAPRS